MTICIRYLLITLFSSFPYLHTSIPSLLILTETTVYCIDRFIFLEFLDCFFDYLNSSLISFQRLMFVYIFSVHKSIDDRYFWIFSFIFCVMISVILVFLLFNPYLDCFVHILEIILLMFLTVFRIYLSMRFLPFWFISILQVRRITLHI